METVKTFEDALNEVAQDVVGLMIRKQHDYGHGNIMAFGEIGVLIRTSDKVERLKNLLWNKSQKVQCESVMDTWADLAGYSLIALMLGKGTFTLPLRKDIK